ncbi:MAG: hypothetical protein KDI69_08625 [Xanthomonadales bacterium]|nr:hypothetical protein [Xanthomonadales bacterium]
MFTMAAISAAITFWVVSVHRRWLAEKLVRLAKQRDIKPVRAIKKQAAAP